MANDSPSASLQSLNHLVGYTVANRLESHIFFTCCALITFGGLCALAINLTINHFLLDIILSAVTITVGIIFNLIGRQLETPEKLGPLLIILIGGFLGVTWFTNHGSAGSAGLFFAPLFLITAIMLAGWSRIATIAALYLIIVSCAFLEWRYPAMVSGQAEEILRFIDVIAVLVVSTLISCLVALLVSRAYVEERTRVARLTEKSTRDTLQLEAAQREVEALRDLLPLCSHCHKIRDESGDWHRLETYMMDNRDTTFSHGICPSCSREHYDLGNL